MATLTVPYSFVAATSIVASEMNSNFGAVKTFVEALAAGTNLDTGAVTSSKLATATIQLLAPTGSINAYAGSAAPTGWLMCDGAAVSRATYADLFALIGTTYGAGDGTTTFNVPDMKGRVIVGKAAAGTFAALNNKGGAETHTLTSAEMPSHFHTADGTLSAVDGGTHFHTGTTQNTGSHAHAINARPTDMVGSGAYYVTAYQTTQAVVIGDTDSRGAHDHTFTTSTQANHTHDVSGNTSNTGGGGAHNNLQPYIVVNYIIKV